MPLSESDKEWISSVASGVEANFGKELARIDERLARFDERLARFDEEIEQLATQESLRDFETRLLTEFHKWASPTGKRLNSHSNDISAMYEELQILRERIEGLEAK